MLIKDVTLLTYDEFKKYRKYISICSSPWWLKTEANENFCYADVINVDLRNDRHIINVVGVRPILIASNINAAPGDKIKTLGFTWTVIDVSNNKEGLLLCNYCIATYHYDSHKNDWETSELKEFLEKWLETVLNETSVAVDLANEAEYVLLQAFANKHNLPKLTGGFLPKENVFNLCLAYSHEIGWDWQFKDFCAYQIITFAEFCERFNKKGEYLC